MLRIIVLFAVAAGIAVAAPPMWLHAQVTAQRGDPGRVGAASALAPATPREFRAAWVASVGNITWPSKRDLSVDEQKKEMISILDRAVALKLNAIIFQVRTQCDALYESKVEPWSEYLTGVEGKAPEPYYDPLAMWVEEAHRRGLELHAWFNPYRAMAGGAKGERGATHVSRIKPDIVRKYGNQLWLDPGDPATIQHSLDVFMDVVKRYDIDGVHIDDYFYPYKVRETVEDSTTALSSARESSGSAAGPVAAAPAAEPLGSRPVASTQRRRGRGNATTGAAAQPERPTRVVDFPDDATWAKYQQSGGKLSRNDWRRQNVNTLIERLYMSIKAEKKHVKFGISPFGIWRPGNPSGVTGLDAYEQLYADSRLWFNRGWCDYFTPQLYWPIEGKQSFRALYAWWSQQNTMRRHLWPGSSVGRHKPEEVLNQIGITRAKPGGGFVFWSYNALARRAELAEALLKGPYAEQALVPASPWLDNAAPAKPKAEGRRSAEGGAVVTVTAGEGEAPRWWAVHVRYGTKWKFFVRPESAGEITIPADAKAGVINSVVVRAVDRCGNESERVGVPVGSGQ